MAFAVDSWKAQVKDSLPTTLYEVTINPPVGGGTEITLRTEAVSTPGLSWLSVDNYSPHGNGLLYNIPYRYNPQEVTMTHTVDEKAEIYKTFRDWGAKIVNLDKEPFAAYYFDSYTINFDLKLYNRKKETAKTVKFIDAYPATVEPISLGWGQYDEIAKFTVSYRFLRFEVN